MSGIQVFSSVEACGILYSFLIGGIWTIGVSPVCADAFCSNLQHDQNDGTFHSIPHGTHVPKSASAVAMDTVRR